MNSTTMRAVGVSPSKREVKLIDHQAPQITSDYQVKIRSLEVGICGTDREEVMGGRADAPPGHTHLIIGHEMLGQVV